MTAPVVLPEVAFFVELPLVGLGDDFHVVVLRNLVEAGDGALDLLEHEGVLDADDLRVVGILQEPMRHGQLDGVLVAVGVERDGAHEEGLGRDDVRVGEGKVELVDETIAHDVRHAAADGGAVGLLGDVEQDDLLDVRRDGVEAGELTVALGTAGDVRVHAGTGDLLADLVDDEHVDARRRRSPCRSRR